jgi:hypothetical protein
MIGFIVTSLQLQSIITSSERPLSDESLCCLNLGLISTTRIHESTAFYNFHATSIEVIISYSFSVIPCFIRCHETCVNLGATL